MLSVQSCSVNSQNVAFKAKEKKSNVNSTSTSHAGLKTAAVWSSIATPLGLANIYLNRLSNNSFRGATDGKMNPIFKGKDLGKIFKMPTNANSKLALFALTLNYAITMGCGALVDKLNNDKRAKFAEELAEKGKDATYEENDYADKTKAGNVYCKSNAGKKWGALLGMGGILLPELIFMPIMPLNNFKFKGTSKTIKTIVLAQSAVLGAIGGFSLGAIADSFSNKTAAKNADKLASKATVSQDVQLESNETEEG